MWDTVRLAVAKVMLIGIAGPIIGSLLCIGLMTDLADHGHDESLLN